MSLKVRHVSYLFCGRGGAVPFPATLIKMGIRCRNNGWRELPVRKWRATSADLRTWKLLASAHEQWAKWWQPHFVSRRSVQAVHNARDVLNGREKSGKRCGERVRSFVLMRIDVKYGQSEYLCSQTLPFPPSVCPLPKAWRQLAALKAFPL